MSEWPQDRIDAEMLDDDGYDPADECGGWTDGKFSYYYCRLAGTEFCDWECPHGAAGQVRSRRLAALKQEQS